MKEARNHASKTLRTLVIIGALFTAVLVAAPPTWATVTLGDGGWSNPGVGEWDAISRTATLTHNLNEGIEIVADNLTLLGSGDVTITGSGAGSGIYLTGRSNITIGDVAVRNFTDGLRIENSKQISAGYVQAIKNLGSGIYYNNCSDVSVEMCTTIDNGHNGMYFSTCSSGAVTNNNIYMSIVGYNGVGVRLFRCQGLTVELNWVAYNHDAGILLHGRSSDNTVVHNYLNGNGTASILLTDRSCGNTIENNHVSSEPSDAEFVSPGVGILLQQLSNSNTLRGNTCEDNIGHGILVQLCSTGNYIVDNTVVGTLKTAGGSEGNGITLTNQSGGNTVEANHCNSNALNGIWARAQSNGNQMLRNETNGNMGSGIALGGCSSNNVVAGNTSNNNNVFGICIVNSSGNISDLDRDGNNREPGELNITLGNKHPWQNRDWPGNSVAWTTTP
ncbi:MAG: right-handed parallel beta-helix repeat-containing protein [Pseudomonadota bacterium]